MKKFMGVWYPDSEQHMTAWVAKHGGMVEGRGTYQWNKQVAVFKAVEGAGHGWRTAVDIGAHIGTWSVNMASRFKKVIAFEPVDEHRECFAENVQADNVELISAALGAAPGSVSISRDANNSGASHVKGDGSVPMITLDSLCLADVDLIKMDVEGYEANVIAGGKETLLRWKPIVCCEQKRDFACKYGLKRTAATDALQALGMKQIVEIGGDFVMGW